MASQNPDPLLNLLSNNEIKERRNDLHRVSKGNTTCRVCGGPGRCVNYGALTCQACRAFFRRHGSPSKIVPPCPWSERCEVNIHRQNRNPCIACRLAQCFNVGMSADYMRKREKNVPLKNRSDRKTNSPDQSPSPPLLSPTLTLDVLRNSRSPLTNSQSTLLSNIIHAYDAFSTIPYACSIEDQLSRLSIDGKYDGSVAVDIIQRSVSSMRSFMYSIPDFQILTTSEQCSLLERNWHSVAGLNFIYVLRDSALGDSAQFTSDGLITYGKDVIDRAMKIKEKLELDSTLIKLMLVILAFSSNCLTLRIPKSLQDDHLTTGTFRLLGSQNVFVELMWNYMLYRFGYEETVRRFSYLVKQALNTINHVTQTYIDNESHQRIMDQLFADDRIIFAASRNVYVPLWGNARR